MREHVQIVAVPCTALGIPLGEWHGQAKYSDADVARARAMRAAGVKLADIAAVIGASRNTIGDWCSGRSRSTLPARHIARWRRVRQADREQSGALSTDSKSVGKQGTTGPSGDPAEM